MKNVNEALAKLLELDGAMMAGLVDSSSGMILGQEGSGLDMDLAAAGNTEVVKAKLRTIKSLELNDSIEDILITLGKQYHIIRPLSFDPEVFIYLVLDKERSNLALARRESRQVEDLLNG
ncbi:MAG: hypothetical protein GVY11_04580 [Gammaproteobacteria bacterium]|jgi:hypothetical protein|nr:hypothetical protein [Gammaproteobacteria bacterium]